MGPAQPGRAEGAGASNEFPGAPFGSTGTTEAGQQGPWRPPEPSGFADEAGQGRNSRRRNRRRRRPGEREPASQPGALLEESVAEGELPPDYVSLPVERGLPVPYEGSYPDEEDEPPEEKPSKSRRVNSGKLFWFIRTKSYVPIPEIRRRFEITPNEVSTIQDDGEKLYVGLPQEIADVVANLRNQQKIGLECSPDFKSKIVIGIYPLRRAQ